MELVNVYVFGVQITEFNTICRLCIFMCWGVKALYFSSECMHRLFRVHSLCIWLAWRKQEDNARSGSNTHAWGKMRPNCSCDLEDNQQPNTSLLSDVYTKRHITDSNCFYNSQSFQNTSGRNQYF